ncbi:uncharacterized protein LOC127244559 [Andrographis paniculata]|uniref:uncharacterized protein LOC127244559 n=1 Tax=Andrographis paniculata TaxID=175694 RepID=UPI0021E713C7|nr:uncharacterized protein LOC127244559 [Andrographis paniculata]
MSKWWRAAAGVLKAAEGRGCGRSYHTIQAVPREITGNHVAARERSQGRIPTVVSYQSHADDRSSVADSRSVSQKLLLTTERKQIKAILKNVTLPFFFSTTFPLQIRAGSGSSTILDTRKVLPVKVHRNEEGDILNLGFVWAEDGTELVVDVPIVYKGEDVCPGLKKGGYLIKIRTSLKYLCPAEHIPTKIEVDVSNLDVWDRISMHDVEVHPSMKLLSKDETRPVCRIKTAYVAEPEDAQPT